MLHAFSPKNTKHSYKVITWSELNHPSLSKRSTRCTRQDQGRKHSILLSVTHMFSISQVCHDVSRKRWELFFVKPGVKVNGQYYWDILLSQQMLDTIKHITGDNFLFQEDSAQVHCMCNNPVEWNCDFRVSPFCQVVLRHKVFEVA